MYKVDLNADLGESFGTYTIGMDSEVLCHITSANVACGFHAGDPVVMEKTVALAKECGVAVGAHPGYPDLMGFGRRNLKIKPAEAKAYIKYQVGALLAFTRAAGVKMQHGKPHAEVNLVYELALDAPEPRSLEDWIEFEWRPLSDLGDLLPEAFRKLGDDPAARFEP